MRSTATIISNLLLPQATLMSRQLLVFS